MILNFLEIAWIFLQVIIGFQLVFPLLLLLFSEIKDKQDEGKELEFIGLDFAIIVTAYEEVDHLPQVIKSILDQTHKEYLVYLVADNCELSNLAFNDDRIIILKPKSTIGSNTGSHQYAIDHFKRAHDYITIIDSDNILHPNYLEELVFSLKQGFVAVQGLRSPKNLDSNLARLDAARDIYYHFYDGKILFKSGSSATLSGSGMAFKTNLYTHFLKQNNVIGAGFDKVLQAWLLKQDIRIAFNCSAIVYDEKTSYSDQLVKQRSRWLNTWFKYFKYGFNIIFKGIRSLSINQFLFGLVLLRPPLFLFLMTAIFITMINLVLGLNYWILIICFLCFLFSFFLSLIYTKTDRKIYASLINIPKFIFLQIISLTKVRKANRVSVATKHSQKTNH